MGLLAFADADRLALASTKVTARLNELRELPNRQLQRSAIKAGHWIQP
jgi:hypothetical protein